MILNNFAHRAGVYLVNFDTQPSISPFLRSLITYESFQKKKTGFKTDEETETFQNCVFLQFSDYFLFFDSCSFE